jgi:hypothetical protein
VHTSQVDLDITGNAHGFEVGQRLFVPLIHLALELRGCMVPVSRYEAHVHAGLHEACFLCMLPVSVEGWLECWAQHGFERLKHIITHRLSLPTRLLVTAMSSTWKLGATCLTVTAGTDDLTQRAV